MARPCDADETAAPSAAPPAPPAPVAAKSLNILFSPEDPAPIDERKVFTARFTAQDIRPLLDERSDLLPLPLRFAGQRELCVESVERINMGALVAALRPALRESFAGKFTYPDDLIVVPVAPALRVILESDLLPEGRYVGPQEEVIGFQLHDIDEPTYVSVAIRVFQTARQLLETGDPSVDRAAPSYYTLAAQSELAELLRGVDNEKTQAEQRQAIRRTIGQALGVIDETGQEHLERATWVKESRRFTYVVRDGQFIDKLRPLVERMNREIELAGYPSPSLIDHPGIHFDADLTDVEILLPRPMLDEFLEHSDILERRMAEDAMITIEVVRLTDRDILSSTVASRLGVVSQGVHDVNRFNQRSVVKQAGINSLMAVANRELQITNLREIEAGNLPAGTPAMTIPPIDLPPINYERSATTIGGDFSVGADDIFFDGREQAYGFSYIGPDGLRHTLSLDVADSLRDFWDRIERNLIVHKIRKTSSKERFSVPVGPENKIFEGIAALISQENQELVVATGTGAISELSATAGTWLVIKEFDITPIPGSSTALTESELREIEERVLLTMLLRDPLVDVDVKTALVDTEDRASLTGLLDKYKAEYQDRPLRVGPDARTFGAVLERRIAETVEDATIEKKERNSKITLTFYSSQGTIINSPGVTALGDANDLTSFTTELSPNVVTPISSFFTKSASGTKDSSSLTGMPKGEQNIEEKTMTHLVVRARFPNTERERKDRDEGRHLGYFQLPMGREPLSVTNLPLLSSSEHPLERLSQLRVGLIFPALDRQRIKKPFLLFNPQRVVGDVPREVYEACTARLLLNERIMTDSPTANQALAAAYRQRFITEVRSLIEYDEDLFDAPNIALRNMAQWNNPHRLILALKNSSERFAFSRLVKMIDELGVVLVPQTFIDDYLAVAPREGWGRHRLRPLREGEVQELRRDVALHFMRIEEVFGDAILEAVSLLLGLGTYQSLDYDIVTSGPFHGYEDLVLFDEESAPVARDESCSMAHEQFLLLRSGGFRGGLFESSLEYIEHLDDADRAYLIRGTDILQHPLARTSRQGDS